MKKRILIGITGGIGAGKSAVAKIIREAGYPVLSADEFAREITKAGSPALKEIKALFGAKSLLPDGNLDRAFVRAEIIRDPKLRLQLEAITHPKIQALTTKTADELFSQGKEKVFYEAPLLFEAKSEKHMDLVICVHANDEIRIQRTMNRDKVTHAAAEKLLLAQMPQTEKMKKSDFLIANDGTEKELERATKEILSELQKK